MPNKCENRLLSILSAQQWHLDRLYAEYSREFGFIFQNYSGRQNQIRNKQLDRALQRFNDDLEKLLEEQIGTGFQASNICNDEFVSDYIKGIEVPESQVNQLFAKNNGAAKAFINRAEKGLRLSDRVWKLTQQTEESLNVILESGVVNGRSAADMARDLKIYLKDPNKRFRRIRDENGKLQLSTPAKNYKPGRGVYRSSYKNALRLSRNEINIAYRTNDFERRKNMPFVMGQRIQLSSQHKIFDICDYMVGTYPKEYKFTGWHPNCYSSDTEVYTNEGWIKFSEVTKEHTVLSLTEDKNLEWANVEFTIKKPFRGEMVRFHNRSLDMLVTPDHPMVYIPKGNTKAIYSNKNASEFDMVKGGLYRSSNYQNYLSENIKIGTDTFDFNFFCQFMGYYLSDGSCTRPYQIIISQREDHDTDNYYKIQEFLKQNNLHFDSFDAGFRVYNENLWNYLQDFGKCNEKYIPEEIKNSSPIQIAKFLNAFVSCDGYIKENKPFIGSRGTICKPKNATRSFFTTSKRMADDIGELLIKIGKRPSFRIQKPKTTKFKNGTYTGNFDLWVIAECHSQSATAFKKELVPYDDFVYDVQLDRNHILLTRRNGKVVWGSNCLCFSTSILLPREKFKNYLAGGEIDNRHTIKNIPAAAQNYLNANADTLHKYKSKPYFLEDNFKYRNGIYVPKVTALAK